MKQYTTEELKNMSIEEVNKYFKKLHNKYSEPN
jgi:ribosomal protein L29